MPAIATLHSITSQHRPAINPENSRASGFTLVEMLVALMLSSIIFVSAYQVMSNLIQYQVRAVNIAEQEVDELLLRNLLDEIISKSLHQSQLYYRVEKTAFFSGKPDSLQLISRAYSSHYDVPGYRVYFLTVKQSRLVVSYRRYDDQVVEAQPEELDTGLEVEEIRFHYKSDGDWFEDWPDNKSLPQWVRVNAELPGNRSLETVFRTSWL